MKSHFLKKKITRHHLRKFEFFVHFLLQIRIFFELDCFFLVSHFSLFGVVFCIKMDQNIPDISDILLRGGTEINQDRRREAEAQINSMLEQNFPLALYTLTNEIFQESKNPHSRRIAGAVFKNALSSKNNNEKKMKEESWIQIDAALRSEMKNMLVQALSSNQRSLPDKFSSILEEPMLILLPPETPPMPPPQWSPE